jgi:hypothetical protein
MRRWCSVFVLFVGGCGEESSTPLGGAGMGNAGDAGSGGSNAGRGGGAGRGSGGSSGSTGSGGGGGRMEPGLGSEGWEDVWCQVHHAECESVTEDSRCASLLMDDDGVVFSFVYPHGEDAPREVLPWRDDSSYAAADGAVTEEERERFGPGIPTCIDLEHESPEDVCARLCGDSRESDPPDPASFPAVPGVDEAYCVAFPVVGENGRVTEPARPDVFCY